VITNICLHLIYHTELQNFLIAPRTRLRVSLNKINWSGAKKGQIYNRLGPEVYGAR